MNILDIISPSSKLLTEANILNVKDPHDGHSIKKYLTHYADSIKTPVAKKMFVKKIQNFLLNDPKYHYAVRELPDDAPEWAQEAMANKDLFFFKPNEDLNTTIEHITHYIAKMEEDMEQTTDKDKKVVATKEFAGFPKSESLDVIAKKSDDYFARGAKTSTDKEGMKQILSQHGFTWYKLESVTAFKNAGDTLQNCIGSHWTKAKADSQGESIIVLLDKKGAMIVAARIKNKENELQEMKGKNNKPPIKAYMPPVAAMINKFKLSIGRGAHNDIINTGYFFDEEDRKLLTKPQAMKKLVSYDEIKKLGLGLTLVQPKPKDDSHSAKSIFNELYTGSTYGGSYNEVFEARNDVGNPIIIATVSKSGKKLERIQTFFGERLHDTTHLQEAVEEQKKREQMKLFVNELVSMGKVTSVESDVERHIFWEVGLDWDEEETLLKNRAEGTEHKTDKKHHKWEKFTDRSSIASIEKTLRTRGRVSYKGTNFPDFTRAYVAKEESVSDRSRSETDQHIAVLVSDEGKAFLTTVSGRAHGSDHVGFKKEVTHDRFGSSVTRTGVDHKTIESLIALAKSEHFELPAPALARFGVKGDTPDKYARHKTEWKKNPGDPESIKADFSELRDEDRFTAVYSAAMLELGGTKTQDLFHLDKKLEGLKSNWYSGDKDINHGDQWKEHSNEKGYKAIGEIDSIYKVNVGYGTEQHHGVLLMVSKDKIVTVDSETEDHRWQGWDDFDVVADSLNKFAAEHNLTFNTDAVTTDKKSSKEFRVADGKVTTMVKLKSTELSRHKKKEGADSLKFADGWVLERMTPEEQGKWIRRGVKEGVRGQAWLLKDDKDNKRAVFTILHQRIARMFYHGGSYRSAQEALTKEWPTNSGGIKSKYFPYLKTAAKTFKWKHATSGRMKSSQVSSLVLTILKTMKDYPTSGDEFVTNNDSNRLAYYQLDPLVTLGLLKQLTPATELEDMTHSERSNAKKYQITPHGVSFIKELEKAKEEGKSLSELDALKGMDLHKDFKMPEKETPRAATPRAAGERTPRTPRAAGGQTKSALALEKFKDHVEDNGSIPTRGEFIAYMEEDPFNMTKSGAQTYYYTTKKKYAALNESILGDLAKLLLVEPDAVFSSFADLIID